MTCSASALTEDEIRAQSEGPNEAVSLRSQVKDPPEAAVDVVHEVVGQASDRVGLLEV